MNHDSTRKRWRSVLETNRGSIALGMVGAPAIVFGLTIIMGLVEPSESMPTGEAASRGAGAGFLAASLILIALLFARSSDRAAAFGAQLPRASSRGVRWALLLLISVAALGIMTGVGMASGWALVAFDVVPPGGADMDAVAWAQSASFVETLSLSLHAGFAEEVLLLALPVAAGAWVGRRMPGARAEYVGMLAGGLAGLAVRSAMHYYQGWTSSVSALLWGGALLLLYLAWRSVYPLITAHIIFDVVVPWWAPQVGLAGPIYWTLVALGLSAIVALAIIWHGQRNRAVGRYDSSAGVSVSPSASNAAPR